MHALIAQVIYLACVRIHTFVSGSVRVLEETPPEATASQQPGTGFSQHCEMEEPGSLQELLAIGMG